VNVYNIWLYHTTLPLRGRQAAACERAEPHHAGRRTLLRARRVVKELHTAAHRTRRPIEQPFILPRAAAAFLSQDASKQRGSADRMAHAHSRRTAQPRLAGAARHHRRISAAASARIRAKQMRASAISRL